MAIKNKSGQVTLFIIIGLLVVAAILLVMYLTGKFSFSTSPMENPEAYLRNCMLSSIKESEQVLLDTNGYPKTDSTNYIRYNMEKIPYLCTTVEYYTPCMPQEPAFINYLSKLMENKVSKDTESCLTKLIENFEKKGYSVKVDPGNISLKIKRDFISAIIGKTIYITKDEESFQIANLEADYGTNFYNLVNLEQTIVNYESTICEFDKAGWMEDDNSIIISAFRASDQTKIYTLKDRFTEIEIKFAIKTCVLPAGV